LTQLNLAATQAEAASVVILGEALEINPSLELLDLSKNDITPRGIHLLIHSLNKNTALKELSLKETKIEKKDVENLRPSLKVNLEKKEA
jgi:Ran GTPase-activating protein (RanGAP) involved in mRNA processing and transport